jgi:hypothetical protein
MEPEGSLPSSQVPATCPYLEPAQSSHSPILFKQMARLIFYSLMSALGTATLNNDIPHLPHTLCLIVHSVFPSQ